MNRKIIWSVVSCLVVATLVLASCAPEEEEEEVVTPEAEEVTPTVDEILSRAKSVTSAKYEMVMSFPGATVVSAMAIEPKKVWAKGNKIRIEVTYQGQTMVTIMDMDKQVAYGYLPAENTAEKEQLQPEAAKDFLQQMSPMEMAGSLAGMSPTAVGSETIDGKDCLVVEVQKEGKTMKVWVWKEYGLPIRMELPNPQGGTMVTEWKNIEFVNIPDDMFELPPGVEIKEQ